MPAVKGLTMGAAAAAGYAFYEPFRFRLARIDVPVEAPVAPLSLLHLSDTHARTRTGALFRWLSSLPGLLGSPPDLLVATGDFVEDDGGIDPLVEALGGLRGRLGAFYVLGSHDYFRSVFRLDSYGKYFKRHRQPVAAPPVDTERLEAGLAKCGWEPLTNRDTVVDHQGAAVRVTGIDDPYIRRHRLDHVRREPSDALAVGLMHSPDEVSAFALRGFDLVLAGHTHAGQVRLPGWGALVTNCSLPAGLAGGLHRVGGTWLHVSPGLGTSRYAPVRFCCRPEATLLQLRPADPTSQPA